MALVGGDAGTGKSAMLGVAREAWEAQGYAMRGKVNLAAAFERSSGLVQTIDRGQGAGAFRL